MGLAVRAKPKLRRVLTLLVPVSEDLPQNFIVKGLSSLFKVLILLVWW